MNQNEKITEGLKQVIDSLCKRYDKEKQESFPKDYPSLYKKIEESKTTQKKVKAIYNVINDLKYYAKNLIPVSPKIEVKMANIIVNDLITGKLDKMLENIITDYEGRSCVRDKVNHIINGIYKFLETGEHVQLYNENEKDNYWCTPIFKSTKSVINKLY